MISYHGDINIINNNNLKKKNCYLSITLSRQKPYMFYSSLSRYFFSTIFLFYKDNYYLYISSTDLFTPLASRACDRHSLTLAL